MHADFASIIEKLEQDATYLELFDQAYGSEEITEDGIAKALAQYIRTILVGRRILTNTLKATTSLLRANSWALTSSITNRETAFTAMAQLLRATRWELWIVAVLQQWPRQYA